jgi:hypothetical protein
VGKVLQFPTKKREDPPSFQAFGMQLRGGNLQGAASVLAKLFGISDARALVATSFLLQRLSADPGIMDILRSTLRESVEAGSSNTALHLLAENFGLDGPESVTVLASLVVVFGKSAI